MGLGLLIAQWLSESELETPSSSGLIESFRLQQRQLIYSEKLDLKQEQRDTALEYLEELVEKSKELREELEQKLKDFEDQQLNWQSKIEIVTQETAECKSNVSDGELSALKERVAALDLKEEIALEFCTAQISEYESSSLFNYLQNKRLSKSNLGRFDQRLSDYIDFDKQYERLLELRKIPNRLHLKRKTLEHQLSALRAVLEKNNNLIEKRCEVVELILKLQTEFITQNKSIEESLGAINHAIEGYASHNIIYTINRDSEAFSEFYQKVTNRYHQFRFNLRLRFKLSVLQLILAYYPSHYCLGELLAIIDDEEEELKLDEFLTKSIDSLIEPASDDLPEQSDAYRAKSLTAELMDKLLRKILQDLRAGTEPEHEITLILCRSSKELLGFDGKLVNLLFADEALLNQGSEDLLANSN